MEIAGIIAEYNPFHSGHAYHIEKTRRLSGCDGIAVLMSGNFVQRGGCAVADKWVRAQAAIRGGADLVLELPTYYAHGVANLFAYGAVRTLQQCGCIDILSFGAECADGEKLVSDARRLISCSDAIEQALQTELKRGDAAYPAAYAAAAEKITGMETDVLSAPNTMLALEYMHVLETVESNITPLCIPRVGAPYHAQTAQDGFSSATAIRHLLARDLPAWRNFVPPAVQAVYDEAKAQGRFPIVRSAFDTSVLSVLRRLPPTTFSAICDMPPAFENRIVQMAKQATSVDELVGLCCVKQYTKARVRRLVWACFLGIPALGYSIEPTYLRVLAFNETGKAILKKMKDTAQLPLVVKAADYKTEDALFGLDVRATDLYFSVAQNHDLRRGGLDYIFSPYIDK